MGTIRTYTIEKDMTRNYFCYGMAVVSERALPKVEDGFLPVQRKLLYSMKKSGFTGDKKYAKTLDIIGSTTPIYVHGDSSLAGAMSLLVDTNETQKIPYLEGDGNFGNIGTTNSYSAPRYTSARLSKFSGDTLFDGLDKGVVKFVGESEHPEPLFLPCKYPNILVISLMGIAVGMSCNFNGFNLKDVCDYTSKYIIDKSLNPADYLIPDFNENCELIYNKKNISDIANTGKGSVRLRGKYKFEDGMLSVYVPYSVTVQSVVAEITSKLDKFKDITDVRDGTGYNKETGKEEYIVDIDIKKGTDIDKLMSLLYKNTQLETNVSYNMNCLINNKPKTRGVNEILDSWIRVREECIRKDLQFDLNKLNKKLHLLHGLRKVLLNTDKAIEIIKNTEEEELINKALMDYFDIDEVQAEAVSNLKLRNINKKYIINQIKVIEELEKETADKQYKIDNTEEIDKIIISDLEEISRKYGKPRQTEIIQEADIKQLSKSELIEEYNCKIAYTPTYIKKYSRSSDSQKVKDDEQLIEVDIESNNTDVLLIFTNMGNRYRIGCHELQTVIASKSLGDYVYNITTMDKDEQIIKVVSIPKDYKKDSYIVCVYDNGKVAKINIESYLSNNKKLQNCYNTDSKLLDIAYITKDVDIFLLSEEGKALTINTERINPKGSRTTQGTTGIKLNEGYKCIASIIGVTKDYNFKLITEKGREKEFMLDDIVSSENERRLFDYIYGRNGNQGNFLINTRTNNDRITNFEIL